ncbi:MAG TPA: flagellar hook-basal body complex protein, partial [Candidatus Krumholzibacteria bacterium]|nr:flagellar hook-basal body complex protein [Candidatus Krumholzibacteria bacterium]
MLQSLKVSETGLLAQKNKLDIVANNLANATTPGFKRMLTTFQAADPEAPGFQGFDPAQGTVDVMMPGRTLQIISAPDLAPGPMKRTGNELDVAIDGEGFFAIRTERGERYTRNGSFTVD